MDTDVKYAGFWIRTFATIIDTIWLYGIIYFFLVSMFGPEILDPEASYTMSLFFFEYVIPFAVVMIFWILKSATPGKMLLKMKIVDKTTLKPVSTKRLFLRYISYFVSTIPLCLGFIWVAKDDKKQGWHDKIANTIVIRTQMA